MVQSVRTPRLAAPESQADPQPSPASFPLWRDPVFLLPTTLLTPALQQLSMSYGYEWPIHFAFVIYFASLGQFSSLRDKGGRR